MKRAVCLVRQNVVYRNDAFEAGLTKLGYAIETIPLHKRVPDPDDILLIWNRYGSFDTQAQLFEQHGAAVIVVENAYVDMVNTKKAFAMALNRHNGAGRWPAPEYSRLEKLKINLKPWKRVGGYILVLPQRGVGLPGVAMPRDWATTISKRLKHSVGTSLIHVRRHPGHYPSPTTLERDCEQAWCAVTWGSSAATKALVEGVPVFYEFDRWIAGSACCHGVENISLDKSAVEMMGDREEMFKNLAWAQWTVEEVATGEPIARLVDLHKRR